MCDLVRYCPLRILDRVPHTSAVAGAGHVGDALIETLGPNAPVATVLDDSQTERVYQAINQRYGLVGRIFNFFSKLRGGAKRTVGLEIRSA